MHKLVLLRHGENQWNKENRFTGWTDVDLTEKGIDEAREAGQYLKKDGYTFDLAYTSVLKRNGSGCRSRKSKIRSRHWVAFEYESQKVFM